MTKIRVSKALFLLFMGIEYGWAGTPAEAQTVQGIEVTVSTSNREGASKTILLESQSVPGALGGVVATDHEKYSLQVDLIFFSDSYKHLPALAISGPPKKNGWILLYSNSILPDIREKAAFLRSAGVPVKSVTTSFLINDDSSGVNVISTATYTQDLIDKFVTRTQFLEMFYYRQVYVNDYMRVGFLMGLPLAWQNYTVVCTLNNNSRFSESGHVFGLGLAPGVSASFGSVSMPNKGFIGSFFLIYNKIWFASSNNRLAKHFRDRLNDFRFGFSVGYRFNL